MTEPGQGWYSSVGNFRNPSAAGRLNARTNHHLVSMVGGGLIDGTEWREETCACGWVGDDHEKHRSESLRRYLP